MDSSLLDFLLDTIDVQPLPADIKWARAFSINTRHPAYSRSGFALFSGRQNTAFNEWYQVNTGATDRRLYCQTERWAPLDGRVYRKELTQMKWWRRNGGYRGSNAANEIRGTDGQQFHPNVAEDDRLHVFSTDVCASFFMEFEAKAKR